MKYILFLYVLLAVPASGLQTVNLIYNSGWEVEGQNVVLFSQSDFHDMSAWDNRTNTSLIAGDDLRFSGSNCAGTPDGYIETLSSWAPERIVDFDFERTVYGRYCQHNIWITRDSRFRMDHIFVLFQGSASEQLFVSDTGKYHIHIEIYMNSFYFSVSNSTNVVEKWANNTQTISSSPSPLKIIVNNQEPAAVKPWEIRIDNLTISNYSKVYPDGGLVTDLYTTTNNTTHWGDVEVNSTGPVSATVLDSSLTPLKALALPSDNISDLNISSFYLQFNISYPGKLFSWSVMNWTDPDPPGNETNNTNNTVPDSDGDGYNDSIDQFPNDPQEWADSDSDGVGDNADDCPTVPGNSTQDTLGCPDSDGDSWSDTGDMFPSDPTEWADSDGDLVGDNSDYCPSIYGNMTGTYLGCPDSDEDGWADLIDNCPQDYGDIGGCPDSDGDGIIDGDDQCPYEPGPFSNDGCPDETGNETGNGTGNGTTGGNDTNTTNSTGHGNSSDDHVNGNGSNKGTSNSSVDRPALTNIIPVAILMLLVIAIVLVIVVAIPRGKKKKIRSWVDNPNFWEDHPPLELDEVEPPTPNYVSPGEIPYEKNVEQLKVALVPRIDEANREIYNSIVEMEKSLRDAYRTRDIAPRRYEILIRDIVDFKNAVQQWLPLKV